jgi:hypothetical protein
VSEEETIWPMGLSGPDARPRSLVFRPLGYLVAILADEDEATRARTALVEGGLSDRDVWTYAGKQILVDRDRYLADRGLLGKMAGALTDDEQGLDLYLAYAQEGRCALWARIPDENDAPSALRALADFDCLHTRYYGRHGEDDIHVRDPSP